MLVRVDDEDDEEAYSDSVHSARWMLRDESAVLISSSTVSKRSKSTLDMTACPTPLTIILRGRHKCTQV